LFDEIFDEIFADLTVFFDFRVISFCVVEYVIILYSIFWFIYNFTATKWVNNTYNLNVNPMNTLDLLEIAKETVDNQEII